MSSLPIAQPPTALFKYFRLDDGDGALLWRLKCVLQDHELYFSRLSELHDPFEGNILPRAVAASTATDVDQTTSRISLAESTTFALPIVRVCCFSLTAENLTMWAHYGGGHKGVCLRFNYTAAVQALNTSTLSSFHVNYASKYPDIPVDDNSPFVLRTMLATKSKDFEYEREVRFVSLGASPRVSYPPGLLESIIFGQRISLGDRLQVERMISSLGQRPRQDQANIRSNDFSVEIVPGPSPVS